MTRLAAYQPYNKMADAVLYGGLVALHLGEAWGASKPCEALLPVDCSGPTRSWPYRCLLQCAMMCLADVAVPMLATEANCKHTAQDAAEFVRYDCEACLADS